MTRCLPLRQANSVDNDNAININYILVLINRIARELNPSSVMVCGLIRIHFTPLNQ